MPKTNSNELTVRASTVVSVVLCSSVLWLTIGSSSGDREPVRLDQSAASSCSAELNLAIEDTELVNADWVAEIITDTAPPGNKWTLNFAVQEFVTPFVHYPAMGNPVPGRYTRYTSGPVGGILSTVELASWFAKAVVPIYGGFSEIQFDFDMWGSGQRMGSLILQDDTYYRGPSFIQNRAPDWEAYSSGCLGPEDFLRRTGPGPINPDFSKSMVVGFSLSNTTSRASHLLDHLIDNFRFSADGEFVYSDPPFGNRAPWAIGDERVIEIGLDVDDSMYPVRTYRVLNNDIDPDGDDLTISSFSQPFLGKTTASSGDPEGLSIPDAIDYTPPELPDLPLIDGPTHDFFTYTITDGEFESEAGVYVFFDYACPVVGVSKSFSSKNTTAVEEDIDLTLIRRFRDEVMKPSVDGLNIVDHYYDKTPELLKVLLIDRPDLGGRAVNMIAMLQPALRDVLDGDGSLLISQAQMDTVAVFFADLTAAGRNSIKQLIRDELERIGPLDDYVGQPVANVLSSVLGAPVGTAVDDARTTPQGTTEQGFVLGQNFPNPFRDHTEITFNLTQTESIELTVYDVQGQVIRQLWHGMEQAGKTAITWNGLDDAGKTVAAGTYFVQLSSKSIQDSMAMTVVR